MSSVHVHVSIPRPFPVHVHVSIPRPCLPSGVSGASLEASSIPISVTDRVSSRFCVSRFVVVVVVVVLVIVVVLVAAIRP